MSTSDSADATNAIDSSDLKIVINGKSIGVNNAEEISPRSSSSDIKGKKIITHEEKETTISADSPSLLHTTSSQSSVKSDNKNTSAATSNTVVVAHEEAKDTSLAANINVSSSSTGKMDEKGGQLSSKKRSRSSSSTTDATYFEDKHGQNNSRKNNDAKKRSRISKSNSNARNTESFSDHNVKRNLSRVFIGNIPKGFDTVDNLLRLFSKFGEIVDKPNIITKSSTSYGFLQFRTVREAQHAIQEANGASPMTIGTNILPVQTAAKSSNTRPQKKIVQSCLPGA